ncbi:MAG: hypothetical protein NC121_10405 [Blautia sp.]|nr:hypothetical protein [Blautia sp.]
MSSQEEYLDQLLRNIMNGGKGQPQPESEMEEAGSAGMPESTPEMAGMPEMSGMDGIPEMSGSPEDDVVMPEVYEMPEMPGMEDASALSETVDDVSMYGMPGMDGASAIPEMFADTVMPEISGADGMQQANGMPEDDAAMQEMHGMPEMAGMGEAPAVPEVYGMPEMTGMGEAPAAPEAYGMPEMAGMGEAPAAPEVYGMPGMTGMGEAPAAPEVYGMPEMAGMGEAPAAPEVYGMPDFSGISGMDEMPQTSGLPEDAAVMPEMVGMTEMSGMGETPAVQEMSDDELLAEIFGTGEVPQMSVAPEMPEMLEDTVVMPEISDDGAMYGMSEMFDDTAMPGASETDTMPDFSEMSGSAGMSEMLGDFEDNNEILGTPVEDTNIEALLKSLEDDDMASDERMPEPSEGVDISSMSEEDIDRLLAESRKEPKDNAGGVEEAFQGDVVDMLKGTKDSELHEIQDLLEKSDNNEAVGDEIEKLLRGAAQDRDDSASGETRPGTADTDAEEQLSPKQQKAMEKKRLKEEKAAAKKAEKEARKAEKAAKKAARKAGKGDAPGAGGTVSGAADGTAAGTEEAVDTALLDSILSEAGKIDGAETISSATGNYNAKVDNIIPDEGEEVSPDQNVGQAPSVNNDLGIDLNNLFGSSADAESAMMAGGGDPDLEGFVSLDGGDMTGIIELGGADEEESKPKKKGFFSRFLEFLTEEEEEEEENEDIKLSEENQGIIEDLDKEKNKKDKKKKGKKKVKKGEASPEDGEEGEDGEEDKSAKKKKAKKPKKEKLPKEKEPVDPRNRLSLKKVMPILLICLSLGAAIIITVYAFVDFTGNRAARDAYYDGDYQTCYQYLYGKDLNETEQIMFGKSQSILTIRLWIREYEMLTAEGAGLEALDSLLQSVNDYPVLYEYAGQCNAAGEVAQEYATILNLLYENYGLTEDQARAIAAEPDDIEYTRQVNAIVQGGAYGSWNEPEPEEDVPLQDELPEETEMSGGSFIDTNTSGQ